jgi:hypothetical protein
VPWLEKIGLAPAAFESDVWGAPTGGGAPRAGAYGAAHRLASLVGYGDAGATRVAALFTGGPWKPGERMEAAAGLTREQLAAARTRLTVAGLCPTFVSGYSSGGGGSGGSSSGNGGGVRYAQLWERPPGGCPAWELDADVRGLASFQSTFDRRVKAGFRPVHVSGWAAGGGDDHAFAAVWRRVESETETAFVLLHNVTGSAELASRARSLAREGWAPTVISGYGAGGADWYVSLWLPRPPRAAFDWRANLTREQHGRYAAAMRCAGFIPTHLSAYAVGGGAPRFASIWRRDGAR